MDKEKIQEVVSDYLHFMHNGDEQTAQSIISDCDGTSVDLADVLQSIHMIHNVDLGMLVDMLENREFEIDNRLRTIIAYLPEETQQSIREELDEMEDPLLNVEEFGENSEEEST